MNVGQRIKANPFLERLKEIYILPFGRIQAKEVRK